MAYYKNMTIRSIAETIAFYQGYTLDEKSFKRYYQKIGRKRHGGNRYHIALYIVEMFILNDTPQSNPPVPYSGSCSVRLINEGPSFCSEQQAVYKPMPKKAAHT